MIEHVILYQMLANASSISDVVSNRIYPVLAPEGGVYPAIVFRTTATSAIADADSDTIEIESTVEIIALNKIEKATHYTALAALSSAVKALFETHRDGFTTSEVDADLDALYFENERDEVFGDDLRVAGRILTYRLMIRQTN